MQAGNKRRSDMKGFLKLVVIGLAAIGAAGFSAAYAKHGQKPAYCAVDHDHRSHDANYYEYYAHDRYYDAGPYRRSGVSFSITVGDGHDRYDRYDRRGGYDRYDRRDQRGRYDGRRNGYRGDRGRLVNREIYDTRYRARIILTEELVRSRRGHGHGPELVCNVTVRGPEARYVSERRVRRIARNECSRHARIRIYT